MKIIPKQIKLDRNIEIGNKKRSLEIGLNQDIDRQNRYTQKLRHQFP